MNDHRTDHEQARLDELRRYRILDTLPEDAFDRLAQQAAVHYHAPIALISLIDERRQWFKACVGLNDQETSREVSFCTHALHSDAPLIVPDALRDERFRENPSVTGEPGIRFYAGAPIITPRGYRLGTLCVIDTQPREFSAQDAQFLQQLAASVTSELELRLALHCMQYERIVLQSIEDAIIVTGPGGRIGMLNRAAQQLYGVTNEALGRGVHELYTPRWLQPSDERAAQAALENHAPWTGHAIHVLPDGRECHVALTITPVLSPDGRYQGKLQTIRDVTEQVRRDTLEHDRHRILELAVAGAALPGILQATLHMLEHQLPGMTAAVMRLRDGRLFNGAPSRLPQAYTLAIDGIPVGPDIGSCGIAAYSGEAAVSVDIEQDPAWAQYRHFALQCGLRSCWSMPILSEDGTVLGTFALYSPTPRAPTAAELHLLHDAAQLAALLIERDETQKQARHQALYDVLTNLPNRTLIHELLGRALEAAKRTKRSVAVGLLDLDDFKSINDSLGSHVGDEVLRQVGARLQSALPVECVIGRVSADEFVVIAPQLNGEDALTPIADAAHGALGAPLCVAGEELFVMASAGWSLYPLDSRSPEALLSLANAAMHRAKRANSGWMRFHGAGVSTDRQVLTLRNALHRALERRELSVHFQPIVHAGTGQPYSVEALLRWQHPEHGFISPATFIPLAEDSGLITPIGEWVLHETCRELQELQRVVPGLRAHVNLSARQFNNARLLVSISGALEASGLHADLLEVEITEGSIMSAEDAAQTMQEIRDRGVRIAIDDFGTGHSNLAYFKRFPAQTLKVDRSFVGDVGSDPHGTDAQIIRTMIGLARALGMQVIAEGVETEAQAAFLREAGCDFLQGWLFAKAMPVEALREWLVRKAHDRALAAD